LSSPTPAPRNPLFARLWELSLSVHWLNRKFFGWLGNHRMSGKRPLPQCPFGDPIFVVVMEENSQKR